MLVGADACDFNTSKCVHRVPPRDASAGEAARVAYVRPASASAAAACAPERTNACARRGWRAPMSALEPVGARVQAGSTPRGTLAVERTRAPSDPRTRQRAAKVVVMVADSVGPPIEDGEAVPRRKAQRGCAPEVAGRLAGGRAQGERLAARGRLLVPPAVLRVELAVWLAGKVAWEEAPHGHAVRRSRVATLFYVVRFGPQALGAPRSLPRRPRPARRCGRASQSAAAPAWNRGPRAFPPPSTVPAPHGREHRQQGKSDETTLSRGA